MALTKNEPYPLPSLQVQRMTYAQFLKRYYKEHPEQAEECLVCGKPKGEHYGGYCKQEGRGGQKFRSKTIESLQEQIEFLKQQIKDLRERHNDNAPF